MIVAIGMPGPFEWLIILAMLAGAFLVLRVLLHAGRPPERRGFDVEPPPPDKRE